MVRACLTIELHYEKLVSSLKANNKIIMIIIHQQLFPPKPPHLVMTRYLLTINSQGDGFTICIPCILSTARPFYFQYMEMQDKVLLDTSIFTLIYFIICLTFLGSSVMTFKDWILLFITSLTLRILSIETDMLSIRLSIRMFSEVSVSSISTI